MLSEHSYTNVSPSKTRRKYSCHKICTAPHCRNKAYSYTKTSLHSFPHNELRAEWGRLLRVKPIPKNAFACSDHFNPIDFASPNTGAGKVRRLKKCAVPSRNLPRDPNSVEAKTMATEASTKETEALRTSKNIPITTIYITNDNISSMDGLSSDESTLSDHEAEFRTLDSTSGEASFASNEYILPELELKIDESTQTETAVHPSQSTQTEANHTSQSTQTEAEFMSNISQSVTMLDMLCTDEKVQEFTGLQSTASFKRFCETFAQLEPKICPSACRQAAELEDRILLTLMKLKVNCSFPSLSAIFRITTTSATTYFHQTLHTMHQFLKHLIPWPTREQTQKGRASCFDRFPDVRLVLDYAEFAVACCGCSSCGSQCYSQYQKTHTLKAELGVSPAGLITHVSPVYGGRGTDKVMFTRSGILDKLQVGDSIMAVKNLFIQPECEQKGIKLIQPVYTNNKQFGLADPADIFHVAQARVHAQQTVQRLRIFKILSDKVCWEMAPYFDEILGVICGITNLAHPALADVEFEK